MKEKKAWSSRPGTLAAVAKAAGDLKDFGSSLRDWQHEVRDKWRGKSDFARRITEEPPLLKGRFEAGEVCDAYLAAYALWLAERVGVSAPSWADPRKRRLKEPWLSSHDPSLKEVSPREFKQFNVFTVPDDSFIRGKIHRQRLPLSRTKAATVRRMLGLTQNQIAQRIGVSPATFRNWESGRIIPAGAADKLLDVILRDPEAALTRGLVHSSLAPAERPGSLPHRIGERPGIGANASS